MLTQYDIETGEVILTEEIPAHEASAQAVPDARPALATVGPSRRLELLAEVPAGLLGIPVERILSGQE